MAKFAFYVGREGQEAVQCVAVVPGKDDLPLFEGGKVLVTTPVGERVVDVSPAIDLMLKQMTVELQHGVRDFVFPFEKDETTKKTSKRLTGFLE